MKKTIKKRSNQANPSHKIPPLSLIPPTTQFLHLAHTSLQNMFLLNRFHQILKLDVSDTFVYNLEKCKPHLSISSINLQNTPLSKKPYYRIMLLISFCPNATIIDCKEVTDEEKMNAISLKLMLVDYIYKGFSLISISPVQIANQKEAFELPINYLDLNSPNKKRIETSDSISQKKPIITVFESPKLRKIKKSSESVQESDSPNLRASRKYKQWRKDNNLDANDDIKRNQNESTISSIEEYKSESTETHENLVNENYEESHKSFESKSDIVEIPNEAQTEVTEQSNEEQEGLSDQQIDTQYKAIEQSK